jgi:hypothetical protein
MVTFSDIEDAFFFVSSASRGGNLAFLCKDTGQIYYSQYSRLCHKDLNVIQDLH